MELKHVILVCLVTLALVNTILCCHGGSHMGPSDGDSGSRMGPHRYPSIDRDDFEGSYDKLRGSRSDMDGDDDDADDMSGRSDIAVDNDDTDGSRLAQPDADPEDRRGKRRRLPRPYGGFGIG